MAPIIRVAGPNEALVRSGGGSQPKITVGGRVIVIPIFFKAQNLSLEVMTLAVETGKVYTKEGVAVTVDGVAQVKVARSEEAIRTAAQQFVGQAPAGDRRGRPPDPRGRPARHPRDHDRRGHLPGP